MLLTLYKRLGLGWGVALSLILLSKSATLAGGWAVITLDELPAQVVAAKPVTIGFVVRQHGLTPMAELTPQITATHEETGESFTTKAEAQGKVGHYTAVLTLPQPGLWNWSIIAFTMDQPMPGLRVLATTPAPASETSGPASWPLLLGVIGLVGTAGTSLLWWRKRAWWAAAPVIAAVLVSGFGFASAATSTAEPEPQEVSPERAALGQELFVAKGCIVCHHHAELSEVRRNFGDFRVGPDLPSVTTLTADPVQLATWLKDPAEIKADTQMPNLELKEAEIEALVTFLTSSQK
jgi:cytochrome c2